MSFPKRYNPNEFEPRLQAYWQEAGVYLFLPDGEGPVYSIDTPPPTVSGLLHLGHVYSYTHTDLIARYRRMRGYRVFYPMGYDDNGLPTERLVERQFGITAAQVGRKAFIEKCLQVSEIAEKEYQSLWQRLGLSVDWRYSYRTIDERSRRISQWSFLELYKKGLVYRQRAPSIWCPECRTAIAQAELNDLERESEYVTLEFRLENGQSLPIATTRPELLPACVAIFVHPEDDRFQGFLGQRATVALFGQQVPILEDPAADPQKGTGVVMCCTFGDTTDKEWWYKHRLPLIEALDREGRMTSTAGEFAGLPVVEARQRIIQALDRHGLILDRQSTGQWVRVHERCDTPVEFIMTQQWFMRVLDFKAELTANGEKVNWLPEHMQARYRSWVENLAWDWCISRQRYFGVPFPLWYCQACGEVVLAEEEQLPVDPIQTQPARACRCGSTSYRPEEDVLDTWATSSMTPQIVGGWSGVEDDQEDHLYEQVFPFSLRPQAHEIIRTWAFYTILKSHYHFSALPWKDVAVSGWGVAGEGIRKVSKSRGGGPMPPMEMIERYSADAVRYWAASTGLGKDSMISEEKIQIGAKLVTKLWNLARFSQPFLKEYQSPENREDGLPIQAEALTPADRWILSRAQRLIRRVTDLFENYDYAAAKSEIEYFFWSELADNYLEMCKQRLYDQTNPKREGARFTLHHLLLTTVKLFAPFLPYVTEEIYQKLLASAEVRPDMSTGGEISIHNSRWPEPDPALEDDQAELTGKLLVAIATTVRRYKSKHKLPLSTEIDRLQIAVKEPGLLSALQEATSDLASITRASLVEFVTHIDPTFEPIASSNVPTLVLVSADELLRSIAGSEGLITDIPNKNP